VHVKKHSVMSKITMRENAKKSGVVATIITANAAHRAPSSRRTNAYAIASVARANSADGRRAASPDCPKTDMDSATALKKNAGLSR